MSEELDQSEESTYKDARTAEIRDLMKTLVSDEE